MHIDGIYNYMYRGIQWLDRIGLFWIAQLIAAEYELMVGMLKGATAY